MKQLKDRTEIAKAINFGKYPVLTIDLADRDEYGLVGCKVNIDNGTFRTGERYVVRATLRVYRDEQTFTTSAGCVCLKASYGYSDLAEEIEYAQAPIIKADQDVVIVIMNSKTRTMYYPYLVHTGKRVSPDCTTPLDFEKVDLSQFF